MKHDDKDDKIEAMRLLLDNLPKENQDTLRFLVTHLAKVATHSEVNTYVLSANAWLMNSCVFHILFCQVIPLWIIVHAYTNVTDKNEIIKMSH